MDIFFYCILRANTKLRFWLSKKIQFILVFGIIFNVMQFANLKINNLCYNRTIMSNYNYFANDNNNNNDDPCIVGRSFAG